VAKRFSSVHRAPYAKLTFPYVKLTIALKQQLAQRSLQTRHHRFCHRNSRMADDLAAKRAFGGIPHGIEPKSTSIAMRAPQSVRGRPAECTQRVASGVIDLGRCFLRLVQHAKAAVDSLAWHWRRRTRTQTLRADVGQHGRMAVDAAQGIIQECFVSRSSSTP